MHITTNDTSALIQPSHLPRCVSIWKKAGLTLEANHTQHLLDIIKLFLLEITLLLDSTNRVRFGTDDNEVNAEVRIGVKRAGGEWKGEGGVCCCCCRGRGEVVE